MVDVIDLPKRKRLNKEQADAFKQLAFEFKLSDDMCAEIDNVIYKMTEELGERWLFVKISPEQFRQVVKTIHGCSKPATTLSVWTTAITYIRQDTGEILATRGQIAVDVNTAPQNVSMAMSELVKMGAIIRKRRGRRVVYFVNGAVTWNGSEGSRRSAAKEAPKLRLVSNRDEESPS